MVQHRPLIWNKKVLVLNKNWQALGITKMPRALSLLTSEYKDKTPKAKIITELIPGYFQLFDWEEWGELTPLDGEDVLRGACAVYKSPQAIKLERCDKFAKIESNFNKKNLFFRDRSQCQFCGIKPGLAELTIDHVIPRSLGGKTNWLNCTTACKKCNFKKSNKRLEHSGMTLLSIPSRPTFDPILRDYEDQSNWPELWLKLIANK